MKPVDPLMLAELGRETTTLCRLWVIEPKGFAPMRFTDHDTDLTFQGNLYRSDRSFQASAIQSAVGGQSQNMEVTVILDEGESGITHYELLRGKYDNAPVTLYIASYMALEALPLKIYAGKVGSVTLPTRLGGLLSLVGNISRLSKVITEMYQPYCRCDFGDSRCNYNLTLVTETFTVTSVEGKLAFTSSIDKPEAHYGDGTLIWLTGANAGHALEVQTNLEGGKVVLFFHSAFPIEVGDTGTITRGCKKTWDFCQNEYNNLPNFRGEPFVPGDRFIG